MYTVPPLHNTNGFLISRPGAERRTCPILIPVKRILPPTTRKKNTPETPRQFGYETPQTLLNSLSGAKTRNNPMKFQSVETQWHEAIL